MTSSDYDSDNYYMNEDEYRQRFVQQYMRRPSHEADELGGGGDDDAEDHIMHEAGGALPVLNADSPMDHFGSPISGDTYQEIPLSRQFKSTLSAKIKKVGFIRQKKWGLDDHLFRIIFNPKDASNHVLLVEAILQAIEEVINFCLKLFKNYYIPRQVQTADYGTMAYLKITEKRLARGQLNFKKNLAKPN